MHVYSYYTWAAHTDTFYTCALENMMTTLGNNRKKKKKKKSFFLCYI